MPSLGRVLTAMVTPFQPDSSLDLDGAQRLAAHLVDTGSDGIVVCGTTGESPTLSSDEKLQLLRAVLDAVSDRAVVVMGAGTYDTAASCRAAEAATAAGAHAVMAVTPYYSRPSQRGLLAHFIQIARSTDLPVVLYDIPSRTSREIELTTLLELAQVPNIVAVKDAAGDIAKTSHIVAAAPEGFEVYSGDDVLTLPRLAVGAVGVISVASHVAGSDIQDLVTTYPSDPQKALEIHLRLLPLFEALFIDSNPVPLKGLLNALSLPAGPVRPPLADATDEVVAKVRAALDAAGAQR